LSPLQAEPCDPRQTIRAIVRPRRPSQAYIAQQHRFADMSSQDLKISGKLIKAIEKENYQLFCKILNEFEELTDTEAPDYNFSTPLHIAIEGGKLNYIREILRNGRADVNRPHSRIKKYPIHLASEMGQRDIVELLVSAGADVNAKMDNGSTALHIAAARSKSANVLEVLRLLLSLPRVSINLENNIGVSPIEMAITKGSEAAVKLFLDANASITKKNDEGGTIEDLLAENMPVLYKNVDLAKNKVTSETSIEERLFDILYSFYQPTRIQQSCSKTISRHMVANQFIEQWNEGETNNNKKVNLSYNNGSYTFLQYACDLGMHDIVEFLLEKGVDPSQCSPNYKYPPLLIAAHHGYYKIIEIFKNNAVSSHPTVTFTMRDGVRNYSALHELVNAESRASVNYEDRDYDRCLSLILDDYTVESKSVVIYPMLDAQDYRGNTPLHLAGRVNNENAILKILQAGANIGIKNSNGETPIDKIPCTLLQSYLDKCVHREGHLADTDCKLVFSYNFLGPPTSMMLPLEYQNSPLVPSPQQLWNNDLLPEAEPLWYLSQSKRHRELLSHPVISSFLCLKWRKIRPYYWSYAIFYLTFVVTVTTYIIFKSQERKDFLKVVEASKQGNYVEPSKICYLEYLLVTYLIFLLSKETFQALLSFRRYIFTIGNYFKLIFLATLIVNLGVDLKSILIGDIIWWLNGAALLIGWFDMAFLLGRHPKVSTYIVMFKTVSINFLHFLFIFSIPIMAFALVFYVVLPQENDYFSSPSKSLLKTFVMSLTGEIEFENIQFGSGNASLFAMLLFVLFVFFIMLVLINLLNGLAVSDISLIQKQSEAVALTSRVELVSYVESILLGDPFKLLTNWPSLTFLKNLPPCNCFSKIYSTKLVRTIFLFITESILLFKSRLPNKQAVFFPNKTCFEADETYASNITLLLDKAILQDAMRLIHDKEAKSNSEKLERKINQIVKEQENLMTFLHENCKGK